MRATGDVPNAGRIVRDNVYGWFERVDRGVYALTPRGVQGLEVAPTEPAPAAGAGRASRVRPRPTA
jgi:hypothetical protein